MSDHGTEYKGTQYDFSDIRRHGAGLWFGFHAMTSGESTREERLVLCKKIRRTAVIFKCSECRVHFQAYLQSNPPEETVDTPAGLFFWTVEFRNAVQQRIMTEKNITLPIYDSQIMFEIFNDMDAGVCNDDCTGEKKDTPTPVQSVPTHTVPQSQSKSNVMRYNPEDYIQIISRNGTVQWMPRPRNTSTKSNGFTMYTR